jgi:hypothetical protein
MIKEKRDVCRSQTTQKERESHSSSREKASSRAYKRERENKTAKDN